jgi:hypothetical protein
MGATGVSSFTEEPFFCYGCKIIASSHLLTCFLLFPRSWNYPKSSQNWRPTARKLPVRSMIVALTLASTLSHYIVFGTNFVREKRCHSVLYFSISFGTRQQQKQILGTLLSGGPVAWISWPARSRSDNPWLQVGAYKSLPTSSIPVMEAAHRAEFVRLIHSYSIFMVLIMDFLRGRLTLHHSPFGAGLTIGRSRAENHGENRVETHSSSIKVSCCFARSSSMFLTMSSPPLKVQWDWRDSSIPERCRGIVAGGHGLFNTPPASMKSIELIEAWRTGGTDTYEE